MVSGPDRPMNPALILPRRQQQVCQDAWASSGTPLGIARPALEARRESTRPIGYEAPVPDSLVIRPDALRLTKVDPRQLLSGISAASLFLGALETAPLGHQPFAAVLPAIAAEAGWRAVLAPLPPPETLPGPWKLDDTHRALHQQIAVGFVSFPFPVEPAPNLFVAKDLYRPTEWLSANFTVASMSGSPGWVSVGSTVHPAVENMPAAGFIRPSDAPVLKWEPRQPSGQAPLAVKVLPTRVSAIMPLPRKWEPLDAVPR
jgi:hypothetical protein